MPCVYVTCATYLRGKSLYDLYSPDYMAEYWRGVYSEAIYRVAWEGDWIVPNKIRSIPIFPPIVCHLPSRSPTRRKRSEYESIQRIRKCICCSRVDHNQTTCTNPIVTPLT